MDRLRAALAWAKRVERRIFTKPVRVALYTSGYGVIAGEVAADNLPAWALAAASPLLLTLLHLSPSDVPEDDQ